MNANNPHILIVKFQRERHTNKREGSLDPQKTKLENSKNIWGSKSY